MKTFAYGVVAFLLAVYIAIQLLINISQHNFNEKQLAFNQAVVNRGCAQEKFNQALLRELDIR